MVKLCGTASKNRVTTPAPVDLSLELGLVMDKFGLSVDAVGPCPAHGSVRYLCSVSGGD